MKKLLWASILLVVLVAFAGLWTFRDAWLPSSESGFRLLSLDDNNLIVSDPDIVSFNSTSREIILTDQASQRLTQMGDNLHSSVYVIKINGEEICQGLIRTAYWSSLPPPSLIEIYFPSDLTGDHALRLLYPIFESGSDLQEQYAKFTRYFDDGNKLTY